MARASECRGWTAEQLLSLQHSCEAHSVLDQVTVVKRQGSCEMTSLRNLLAELQTSDIKPALADTATYTSQFRECYRQHVCAGKLADASGKLLYYPFGGVDVVSAVALSPACVVFAGSEEFGTTAQALSHDLNMLLSSGSPYMLKGMGATMFDSHDDFQCLHEELGLGGVGAMALLRLVVSLRLVVRSVSFFELTEDGDIIFASPREQQGPCQHAVVSVQMGPGPAPHLCQLWFLNHNTRMADVRVDAFCERLRPDVLLVKAAPDTLWQPDDLSVYRRCVSRSLQPAAHSDCTVITDSCQANPALPPRIFKESPESIAFAAVRPREPSEGSYDVFGYGERLFWSNGTNLVGQEVLGA